MIKIFDLMESNAVAITISCILGFGLATIFRPLCKGPECIVMRGPQVDPKGTVYQIGEKCIEFKPHIQACPANATGIVKTISIVDYEQ